MGVLAFVQDVGAAAPVHDQQAALLLLNWLTSQPARLTSPQVHQSGSTLDVALPPRAGPAASSSCPPPSPPQRDVRSELPPHAAQLHLGGRHHAGTLRARRPEQPVRSSSEGCDGWPALAALILIVALPIVSHVLPPLVTRLVEATVPTPTPAPPPQGGGRTAPTSVCAAAERLVPAGGAGPCSAAVGGTGLRWLTD